MSSFVVRASEATVAVETAAAAAATPSKSPGRGRREAGLDHVDAQLLQRSRDLGLLGRSQRDARRLLAVPQSRVENRNPAHSMLLRRRPIAGALLPSDVGVCGVQRPRECVLPLVGENRDDRKKNEAARRRRRGVPNTCRRGNARVTRNDHRRPSLHRGRCVVKLQNLKRPESKQMRRRGQIGTHVPSAARS